MLGNCNIRIRSVAFTGVSAALVMIMHAGRVFAGPEPPVPPASESAIGGYWWSTNNLEKDAEKAVEKLERFDREMKWAGRFKMILTKGAGVEEELLAWAFEKAAKDVEEQDRKWQKPDPFNPADYVYTPGNPGGPINDSTYYVIPMVLPPLPPLPAPLPVSGPVSSGGSGGSGGSCPIGRGGPNNPCGSCPNGNCWSGSSKPAATKSSLASLPKNHPISNPTHQPITDPAHHPKPDPKPVHHAKTESNHHPTTTRRGGPTGPTGPAHSPTTPGGHPPTVAGGHAPTIPGAHPPTLPGGGIHPVSPGGLGGLHGFRPGNPGGMHGLGGLHHSDVRLKRDIVLLGRLPNGLNIYRFRYVGHDQLYVGVMAQEVESIAPDAVVRDSDGYLRVNYDRLGFPLQTWEDWLTANK